MPWFTAAHSRAPQARCWRASAASAAPKTGLLLRWLPRFPVPRRRMPRCCPWSGPRYAAIGSWASALIAACIVVPQLSLRSSPLESRQLAVVKGRRPVLLLGFAAPRAACSAILAFNSDRHSCGSADARRLCAAVLGVLVPLSLPTSPGNRPLQSGAGDRRNCHGHRGGREHHFSGIPRASVRKSNCISRPGDTAVLAFLTVLLAMPETGPRATRHETRMGDH